MIAGKLKLPFGVSVCSALTVKFTPLKTLSQSMWYSSSDMVAGIEGVSAAPLV